MVIYPKSANACTKRNIKRFVTVTRIQARQPVFLRNVARVYGKVDACVNGRRDLNPLFLLLAFKPALNRITDCDKSIGCGGLLPWPAIGV